jgi:ribonuclease VapC
MIAVDTSAVVAIVFNEAERALFRHIVRRANRALISSVSVVESRLVIHGRRGQRGIVLADNLLRLPVFEIVPPGAAEMEAAYAAFVAYGKGSGHPANLNFGDLFAYALAKVHSVPLLFKGNDFVHTDIQSAGAAFTAG